MPVMKTSVINNLKVYFFPSLVSILAMLIWRDVSELRSDVKQLLAESNANKIKVQMLEKQVDLLNEAVFHVPKTIAYVRPSRMPLFGKHEEIYDIKKHLKS